MKPINESMLDIVVKLRYGI